METATAPQQGRAKMLTYDHTKLSLSRNQMMNANSIKQLSKVSAPHSVQSKQRDAQVAWAALASLVKITAGREAYSG
jgi:hypothetical protein